MTICDMCGKPFTEKVKPNVCIEFSFGRNDIYTVCNKYRKKLKRFIEFEFARNTKGAADNDR